jgi:hypothetical protein
MGLELITPFPMLKPFVTFLVKREIPASDESINRWTVRLSPVCKGLQPSACMRIATSNGLTDLSKFGPKRNRDPDRGRVTRYSNGQTTRLLGKPIAPPIFNGPGDGSCRCLVTNYQTLRPARSNLPLTKTRDSFLHRKTGTISTRPLRRCYSRDGPCVPYDVNRRIRSRWHNGGPRSLKFTTHGPNKNNFPLSHCAAPPKMVVFPCPHQNASIRGWSRLPLVQQVDSM